MWGVHRGFSPEAVWVAGRLCRFVQKVVCCHRVGSGLPVMCRVNHVRDVFWFAQFLLLLLLVPTRTMKCSQRTKPISSTVHENVLIISESKDTNNKNGPFTSGEIPSWWTFSGQKIRLKKSREFAWWLVLAVAGSRGMTCRDGRFLYNSL